MWLGGGAAWECVCCGSGVVRLGIREVSRWWKAGQSVEGIESQACVVLCSLQVVVVDGNDTLDGLG